MSIVPINSSPYYLRGLNLDSVRLGLGLGLGIGLV